MGALTASVLLTTRGTLWARSAMSTFRELETPERAASAHEADEDPHVGLPEVLAATGAHVKVDSVVAAGRLPGLDIIRGDIC